MRRIGVGLLFNSFLREVSDDDVVNECRGPGEAVEAGEKSKLEMRVDSLSVADLTR